MEAEASGAPAAAQPAFFPGDVGRGESSEKMTLVTGASSNHFVALLDCVRQLRFHEPGARVVVYDLGLSPRQRRQVSRVASSFEIRTFDYSRYPDWVNIRRNAGQYAWKPIIFSDLARETDGFLFWLDAGTHLHEPLWKLREVLRRDGIYSPKSSGTLERWTHPETLRALNVPAEWRQRSNRSGGMLAIDTRWPALRALAEEWRRLALIRECIAPPGSSRRNHRQDQALLSILMHRHQESHGYPSRYVDEFLGFTAWNDHRRRTATLVRHCLSRFGVSI